MKQYVTSSPDFYDLIEHEKINDDADEVEI